MCPGLKCSSNAKNEDKMEIFSGLTGMFFVPTADFANAWGQQKAN